ncbi:hypothetical protein ACXR2T_12030 [Leucobacter sp. HY1910]
MREKRFLVVLAVIVGIGAVALSIDAGSIVPVSIAALTAFVAYRLGRAAGVRDGARRTPKVTPPRDRGMFSPPDDPRK